MVKLAKSQRFKIKKANQFPSPFGRSNKRKKKTVSNAAWGSEGIKFDNKAGFKFPNP